MAKSFQTISDCSSYLRTFLIFNTCACHLLGTAIPLHKQFSTTLRPSVTLLLPPSSLPFLPLPPFLSFPWQVKLLSTNKEDFPPSWIPLYLTFPLPVYFTKLPPKLLATWLFQVTAWSTRNLACAMQSWRT